MTEFTFALSVGLLIGTMITQITHQNKLDKAVKRGVITFDDHSYALIEIWNQR